MQRSIVFLAISFVVAGMLAMWVTADATPTVVAGSGEATPTPPSPGVRQLPAGNTRNVIPNIPAANIWICDGGACSGPGEGTLRVVAQASGVNGGLGGYELTIEHEISLLASLNSCDLVFGPGGAGASRGPVDELDGSVASPDCAPDPGSGAPGTCLLSVVLESLVHFGCSTAGQNAGPSGNFALASFLLTPHPDVKKNILPVPNNGALTVVQMRSCALVDTLGDPVPGSVQGGLAKICGELAVTVRALEADFDLDCDVDAADAQAVTSRYGAFFGGMLYDKRYDLEPAFRDLDIDIKDVQKVYGRLGSTCQAPIPDQRPRGPDAPFKH